MIASLNHDEVNLLYAVAFFVMLAAAVFEAYAVRKLTWALLVSVSWACAMFVWWQT